MAGSRQARAGWKGGAWRIARPKTPATRNQKIRLLASPGGFLGRKRAGEPGAKTIRIGIQRTIDAALTNRARREASWLPYGEIALTGGTGGYRDHDPSLSRALSKGPMARPVKEDRERGS
ncbi:IS4 family transposase [Cupriavidus malaysiensis]|uniref:IS4 family transposase n=1 Tax=Cupriavidus malaysiensis TaxID=367825 RepID=UPI001F2CE33F|nr:IS4 family transposase [Cupriavidus malaysiensis]